MKKMIMGIVAAAFLTLAAWAADDSVLKAGHPDEYTVKKGDTLWDISNVFLSAPWKWPEIWHANPQIENPHLTYPGDLIHLVYIDGQPRLTNERTLKLLPGDAKLSPKVRALANDDAITAIPLDRIDSFLSHSRVVEVGELEKGPYILAGPQKRIVVGAGDQAYARGQFSEGLTNYGVFRQDKVFTDPKTKEVLGVYALGLGSVNVTSFEGDMAKINVVRAYEEIRLGDRLLPSEDRSMNSMFYPSAPDDDIHGVIISVEGGVTQVGKYNVVMINRGEREGMLVGNVLAIYKAGDTIRDTVMRKNVTLPDERAGLLMVFRTFEKMSFALVLEADRPLAVGDKVQNP